MSELVPITTVSWEELQRYVYDADGSWRDIYVRDAGRAGWKIWADFVNANFRVVFVDGAGVRHSQIDFAAVESCWNNPGRASTPTATFFVGAIDVACHFFSADELENDIDPRKIDSVAAHQQLMSFLVQLSSLLGK